MDAAIDGDAASLLVAVGASRMSRSRICLGSRLHAVDEVRRALRVAGGGEDRAVVCLEPTFPIWLRKIGNILALFDLS
jgi:hypothetical protein